MTPDEYCQQKAAASGSSFYYSFLFLSRKRRRAITALYAFCREVDDVVDETSDPQVAGAKLAWWRAEIANHAAGVVGLLAAGIFGYRDARTLDYAKELGIAFQLTNIIRDVGEDARKNRIYLPMEDMRRFGVTAAEILQGRDSPRFKALMAFQAERAQQQYKNAIQALPREDRRAQRPGLIMAAIYRALLQEIESDGFRVLNQRTSLTPLRKFWIAWKTWVAPSRS